MDRGDRGDDAGGLAVSRRDLLKSGVGAAAVGGFAGRASRPVRAGTAGYRGTAGDRWSHGDSLSVREAAHWVDREHPPRRLRGNGPPFADREEASIDEKNAYRGQQTLWHPRTFEKVSYDFGMINRTSESGAVIPMTKKGLLECHRWAAGGADWRSVRNAVQRHDRGVRIRCLWLNAVLYEGSENQFERARPIGRAIARDGYDVVALCEIRDDRLADALVDGYLTGRREKVADTRGPREEKVVSGVASAYHAVDDAVGKVVKFVTKLVSGEPQDPRIAQVSNASGLVTVLSRTRDDRGNTWRLAGRNKHTFSKNSLNPFDEDAAQTRFKIFTRGYQRHTIDVDGGSELTGFELFSTHLEGNQTETAQEKKIKQLQELTDAVADRQQDRRTRGLPKIVVGDLNFGSKDPGYHGDRDLHDLVDEFAAVDMDDAWTTRGGPIGDTHGGEIPRSLRVGKPYPDRTGTDLETCYCGEFDTDDYKNDNITRLDYVFVEKPKPHHDVTIDISRMWRVPLSLDCPHVDHAPDVGDTGRLVDHAGIGFELLVTPK